MNKAQVHLRAALRHLDRLARQPNDSVSLRSLRGHLREASSIIGPSSGTDSADQPSMTGLDDGTGVEPYCEPGGQGPEDVSLTPKQPGGDLDDNPGYALTPDSKGKRDPEGMDDGGDAPDGVAPDHHRALVSFGFEHDGDGSYSHSSGTTATSTTDSTGTPHTRLSSGEMFTDAEDLAKRLGQLKSGPVLDSDDEKTAKTFAAERGHNPEAYQYAREQLAMFKAYRRMSPTSDLTFSNWLKANPMPGSGGMIR